MSQRKLYEVVEVTCTCEVGIAGERAVVTVLEGRYMTLTFTGEIREPGNQHWRTNARVVRTGADYKFLRTVLPGVSS